MRSRIQSPGFLLTLLFCALFSNCESTSSNAPAVTPAMRRGGASQQILTQGRALFVSRCIDCHVLPVISKYSADEWPALADKMSGRASLKPGERDAIVAYILAARGEGRQPRELSFSTF